MGDSDDHRGYSRDPIELKVEYKKLNSFFADYTRNISKGGTFIKTARPLDIGTEFIFKLVVPKLEQPLALRGAVKWLVKKGHPPPEGIDPDHEPGMGIRFIYKDDDESYQIEQIVGKLMIDSLGQLLYSRLMSRGLGEGG